METERLLSRMRFLAYTFRMRAFKWLGIIGIAALAAWGVKGLLPKAKTAWSLRQENERLRSERAEIEKEQDAILGKLHELDVPRLLEQEAKARLQVRRPGEEVVVIVPSPNATPPAAPAGERGAGAGFFSRVRDFFSRVFQ